VSNSVRFSDRVRACKKIKTISLARLLGEAIRRIHNSDSVSSLFV
jgi:ribose-phosphate pyrophosphokinase